MQSLRSLLAPAVLVTWMSLTSGPVAQTPPTRDPGTPPQAESHPTTTTTTQPQSPTAQKPARRRGGFTVIEAGTVHPVSGPPIKNGVVLIRGERIFAVGQQGDLQLPPNTKVLKFPDGHVYPGLIDASTDVFTDELLRGDRSLNAGSVIADGLAWTDSRDDHLVEHGVTTAYVNVRTGAQMPGQGAIVRPRSGGFDLWEDKEQAAVQLRMTNGNDSTHPLQRQTQLESVSKLFDDLDKYLESQEKYEKDLETYDEDFKKYLEHHAKKNGKDKKKDGDKPSDKSGGDKTDGSKTDGKGEAKPGEAKPAKGTQKGRRGRRGEGREPPKDGKLQDVEAEELTAEAEELTAEAFEQLLATVTALVGQPQAQQANRQDPVGSSEAKQGAKPDEKQGEKAGEKASKDSGPKRPTYPKKPTEDLQKEALNMVLDGDLPLRIEAHRVDELRAALKLQHEKEIPLVVLEQAYGADRVTEEIAAHGATVVLTDVLPFSLAAPGDKRNAYAKYDPTALPLKLNVAGVPFAIAGGTARLSAMLPMMAAAAIGSGLSEEAALRAITLTPAEILGIAKDTGSLTRNKFADVIVTDGPLFASDSRVLLVLSKGRTEHKAK